MSWASDATMVGLVKNAIKENQEADINENPADFYRNKTLEPLPTVMKTGISTNTPCLDQIMFTEDSIGKTIVHKKYPVLFLLNDRILCSDINDIGSAIIDERRKKYACAPENLNRLVTLTDGRQMPFQEAIREGYGEQFDLRWNEDVDYISGLFVPIMLPGVPRAYISMKQASELVTIMLNLPFGDVPLVRVYEKGTFYHSISVNNTYKGLEDFVGSSHCQAGQVLNVYEIDEDDIDGLIYVLYRDQDKLFILPPDRTFNNISDIIKEAEENDGEENED